MLTLRAPQSAFSSSSTAREDGTLLTLTAERIALLALDRDLAALQADLLQPAPAG